MSADRPLLIFISDIHLTDTLHGTAIGKAAQFERFWGRIQQARGHRPAELCFVGDLFDIVRSPSWFDGRFRPYNDPRGDVGRQVVGIVERTIEREAEFFASIRKRVENGELRIHYVLGNHDRLLRFVPEARQKVWKALTGSDETPELGTEAEFPEHGVLAYHGNVTDEINFDPDGAGTIGDAIGSELITRFPGEVRKAIGGGEHAELDDIDDVRPIYAVPAWVRNIGLARRELLGPVGKTWKMLVEEFLSNSFVKHWMKDHRTFGFDTGKKLKLLLELSTKKVMAHTHDRRLTQLYKYFQHSFDGKMAKHAAKRIDKTDGRIRYVVNGHSHFSNMVPLGNIDGNPAVYFNTGTWRTVHQIGHGLGGRPSFLPYDAMSYLVFFPDGDPLERRFEWWHGASVTDKHADQG
jgi:UDP-2,3-diacylglucosamine pyrophosphatase LpxH